jgi:DNA mismatch repair protein MutL
VRVAQLEGVAAGEFAGQETLGLRPGHSGSGGLNYGGQGYQPSQPINAGAVREQMNHYGALHQPTAHTQESAMPSGDSEIPPLGYAIAQLKGIYILAENAQGLIIVDMHAAHERITYERMKAAFAEGGIQTQPLLVPESVAVSQKEADCAEQHEQTFRQLGFELQRAGPESLLIRQVPVVLNRAVESLRGIVEELSETVEELQRSTV